MSSHLTLMSIGRASRWIVLLALAITIFATSATHSAEVGLFMEGSFSSACRVEKFIPPMVTIVVVDLDVPLAAVHFSMINSSGIPWYPPIREWWSPTTGPLDDLSTRFEECLEVSPFHRIDLFFADTPGNDDREELCIGPPASDPGDPPAILAESCDGEFIALELAETNPPEVPGGCIWLCRIAALDSPSWGMLKTAY